ncbi:MAG: class B sortase [Lachnospiraceae bacterium]|nr:class B sortase [Lachnospiraceae bacterium]
MSKKRKFFIFACLLIALLGIGYIVYYYVEINNNNKVYEKIQDTTKKKVTKEVAKEEPPEKALELPIDFAELQKMNTDIYAWVEIPGTNINYPIVQSDVDDTYYLMRTVEKQEGYPGSIYTEKVNAKDFTDFNTIIYGHEMKDGSMFGELKNYRDSAYMNAHPEIIIYTPDSIRRYKVFAAVTFDDRHIMQSFDFQSKGGIEEYLNTIFSIRDLNSLITEDASVNVNSDSSIITLSTCIASLPDNRLLVEAVLVNEQQ